MSGSPPAPWSRPAGNYGVAGRSPGATAAGRRQGTTVGLAAPGPSWLLVAGVAGRDISGPVSGQLAPAPSIQDIFLLPIVASKRLIAYMQL